MRCINYYFGYILVVFGISGMFSLLAVHISDPNSYLYEVNILKMGRQTLM